MAKWVVKVHGEGFRISFEDGIWPSGFFTTRYVEADSAEAAEGLAVDCIRRDVELVNAVANAPEDSPRMFVTSLREVPDWAGVEPPGKGYTFYRADSAKSGQGQPAMPKEGFEIRVAKLKPLGLVAGSPWRDAKFRAAERDLRERLRTELMQRHAAELAAAGWFRRRLILRRVEAEVRRQLMERLFSAPGS